MPTCGRIDPSYAIGGGEGGAHVVRLVPHHVVRVRPLAGYGVGVAAGAAGGISTVSMR